MTEEDNDGLMKKTNVIMFFFFTNSCDIQLMRKKQPYLHLKRLIDNS